jgi:hypothetical protein
VVETVRRADPVCRGERFFAYTNRGTPCVLMYQIKKAVKITAFKTGKKKY